MAGAPARGSGPADSSERCSRQLGNHGDVLVATATQVDQDEFVRGSPRLHHPGDSVGALESRKNTFQSRQGGEGVQSLLVRHGFIQYATRVFQVSMLGADTRIVETGRNAVRRLDLSVGVLEQVAHASMEDARPPGTQSRGMFTARYPFPGCFDSHELYSLVFEKSRKDAHGVRAPTDAGHHGARQATDLLEHLRPRLPSDHRLEIAYQPRKRIRPDHGANDVVRRRH